MDRLSKRQRSLNMAAVRGANTLPELYVRKTLFSAGFRYRLHVSKLPGKPDVSLPRYRTAVFVHGCFWHGHGCRRGKRPATNREFWNKKIDGNIQRDRRNKRALKMLGWKPVVIWQCRIERDTAVLVHRLKTSGSFRVHPTLASRRSERGTLKKSTPA